MATPKRRADATRKSEAARRNGAVAAVRPVALRSESRPQATGAVPWRGAASLEGVAWIVIAAVALGLRLINVDGNPLQAAESSLAMDSWRIVHHDGVSLGSAPLLVYLNAVLFLLVGATDAVARSVPVCFGTALALSPLALREQLGRIGALAASLILATSPTLVFASRTLDPAIVSVTLGLALVLVVGRYRQTRRPWLLQVGAAIAALLLISGPLAYDLVIVVVGFAVLDRSDHRVSPSPPRLAVERPEPDRIPSGQTTGEATGPRAATSATLPLGRLGLVFGLTLAVVGTGLATNLVGFGVSLAEPLAAWGRSLSGFAPHAAWLYPALLVGYEPCALLFGAAGAVQAFRRNRAFGVFLGWWACVGLLLLVVADGRDPIWAALVVVPLGLLAGSVLDALPGWFAEAEPRRRLGIFAAVVCPLIATTLIAFGYVTLPNPLVPPEVALAPPLAILGFTASFAFAYDWRLTWQTITAIVAAGLLAFNVHAAMLLNPGGELNPAELFTGTVTSPDTRTLAADVATILDELQIARQIQGRPVDSTVEIATPFAQPLVWYLKDQPSVRVVGQITGSPGIAIVAEHDKPPRGPYAGRVYQFSVSAPPPALGLGDLWRWWMYHEASSRRGTNVNVFVKTQLSQPERAVNRGGS